MKSHLFSLGIFLFIPFLWTLSCKEKESAPDPLAAARQKVIDDYNNNYLGSNLASSGWTGNTASCIAGTVSAESHAKTLQRINYFRRQVGLNDNITFDTTKNRKCQEAALMMTSNGALNHTPPTSWKCYTADGAAAAGASNLSSGSHSSGAITQFMQDFGSSNQAVGHRRWILYSRAIQMGHGSTHSNSALWVIGGAAPKPPANMPAFISWPPSGYVPAPLVYARWSFGIPGADFTNTKVEMKNPAGAAMALNIVHFNGSYGDRTIVWEPTGVKTNITADEAYQVTVKDVKLSDGTIKSFNYSVTLVKI